MAIRFFACLVVLALFGHSARAELQEVPIPQLHTEPIPPPFADGDEISLWCAGDQDGSRYLDGSSSSGEVKLSATGGEASPGTRWRVKAHADGSVSFKCLGAGPGDAARWLNGLTEIEEARVLLAAAPDARATGAFWKIYALGGGEFALRCQGDLAGVRWLNGYTVGGEVSLAPETTGRYTGTHWKIQVVAGGFAAPTGAGQTVKDGCQLSIWNQHNGDFRDRGTELYQVEALFAGQSVWKSPELRLPWSPLSDAQAKVDLPLPAADLDEIRIHILRWIGHGGGLSEVRLIQGGHDLTAKCKVSASDVWEEDARFKADCLVDGITTSETVYTGYWLLPDNQSGVVRIMLPPR